MKLMYGQAGSTIAILYLGKDILQMYLENYSPTPNFIKLLSWL